MVIKAKRKALFSNTHITLYEGPEPGTILHYFKDDIILSKKTLTIPGKGVFSNIISSFIQEGLSNIGLPTTYLATINMREQIMLESQTLPFSIVLRNTISPDRAKSMNIEPSLLLETPLIEFCTLKQPSSFLGSEAIKSLGWATKEELKFIKKITLRINDYLTGVFHATNFQLVDFKVNFGRIYKEYEEDSSLVIACQFSPETFSLIDIIDDKTYPIDTYYKSELRKKSCNQNLLKLHETIVKRLNLHQGIKNS